MRITTILCATCLALPGWALAWDLPADTWTDAPAPNTIDQEYSKSAFEWGWHRWQAFGSGMQLSHSAYTNPSLSGAIDPLNLTDTLNGRLDTGLIPTATSMHYRVAGNSRWSISALAAPGFRGFSSDDASRLYGIGRRDGTMEGGFKISYEQMFADFSLSARHDLEDTHEGYELEAAVRAPIFLGSWVVAPDVAYTYWDDKRSDYYYGVRDAEVVNGMQDYRLNGTGNWSLGLTGIWSVTPRSSFTMGAKYYFYDEEILNSPLVENGYDWRFFVGWGYDFGGNGAGSGTNRRRR